MTASQEKNLLGFCDRIEEAHLVPPPTERSLANISCNKWNCPNCTCRPHTPDTLLYPVNLILVDRNGRRNTQAGKKYTEHQPLG